MKRTTLLLATAAVLGSTLALADNNYPFDDAFWMRSVERTDGMTAGGSDALSVEAGDAQYTDYAD